eukprot:TRINITY_DN31820_c0_g1_i1.p1 TRINITY_DN31820_c0_g1~~TRINITY_DN31820_c0_g1_i1.p1  ORF type:complete len:393 (-),score=17.70 TRINITY_DN31820_c0_g1_i1:176-1354(-)
MAEGNSPPRRAIPLLPVSRLMKSTGASFSEAVASLLADGSRPRSAQMHRDFAMSDAKQRPSKTPRARRPSSCTPLSSRSPTPSTAPSTPTSGPSPQLGRRASSVHRRPPQCPDRRNSLLQALGSPAPRNRIAPALANAASEPALQGPVRLSENSPRTSTDEEPHASEQFVRRVCQGRDICHPCRGCGAPITQMGEVLVIWSPDGVSRRFHAECAAHFDFQQAAGALRPDSEGRAAHSLDDYADAWRRNRLSDAAIRRAEERRAERHERSPRPSPSIRAGAMAALQEQRDAQNLTEWQKQMAALRAFTDGLGCCIGARHTVAPECAICLGALFSGIGGTSRTTNTVNDPGGQIVALPCSSNHIFHASCLEPWLRKSFRCPLCRADLRSMLACP